MNLEDLFPSDEEDIPLDPVSLEDVPIGSKDCLADPIILERQEERPFFEDSSDHHLPQGGLGDPSRDIITLFIPQTEEYPGAAAILTPSESTIDDLNWRESGSDDGENGHEDRCGVFTPCPPEKDPRWWPFDSEDAYNFGEWLVTNDVPVKAINVLFNGKGGRMPLNGTVERSFKWAYGLRKLIDQMPDGLGWRSWKRATTELN